MLTAEELRDVRSFLRWPTCAFFLPIWIHLLSKDVRIKLKDLIHAADVYTTPDS